MVAYDMVLSRGQIELNGVFMLNWIVLNRTVYDCENVIHKIELFEIELFRHLNVCKQKLCLYWTKLFELELFD